MVFRCRHIATHRQEASSGRHWSDHRAPQRQAHGHHRWRAPSMARVAGARRVMTKLLTQSEQPWIDHWPTFDEARSKIPVSADIEAARVNLARHWNSKPLPRQLRSASPGNCMPAAIGAGSNRGSARRDLSASGVHPAQRLPAFNATAGTIARASGMLPVANMPGTPAREVPINCGFLAGNERRSSPGSVG